MAGEQLSWRERLTSARAWSDVAHNFRGDWQMLYKEIALGFLLAGFIAQLGNGFFEHLFIRNAPAPLPTIENVIVGPIIAVLSFVCSVGNVPLAAVLWSGGISFAGVLAFLFADLIVMPILADLPQVLRHRVHGPDHRADVHHDGDRRADRRRHLQRARADPDRTPSDPRGHLQLDPPRLQARAQRPRRWRSSPACSGSPPARGATDPVCGMKVDRDKAVTKEFGGADLILLLDHCLHAFEADPEQYLSATARAADDQRRMPGTTDPNPRGSR